MRLAVDLVIFTIINKALNILLIKRGREPFEGSHALPGGGVNEEEGIEAAARRELEEETGLKNVFLEQLFTFGEDPKRDPRNRVVSIAYYALVSHEINPKAGDDAADAFWMPVSELPKIKLAFDHDQIIKTALERLRGKVVYAPIAHELLPREFTLSELKEIYETILEKPLDKGNFFNYVKKRGLVVPTAKKADSGGGRPATLYRFNKKVKDLADFMSHFRSAIKG